MSESNLIAVRNDHGIVHLTLNRPEARNAMSLAMVDELIAKLAQAEADTDSRVVVLRGAGGHFCAGADLKDMAAARAQALSGGTAADAAPMVKINRRFGELCAAFAESPLAIVTVLEGSVMGGGFGLACASDVCLADNSATFRLPETSLGLVPAQIAPYLVERLGYSEARRLAVTGGRIDAATAKRIGLVHELFPSTAALDCGLELVLNDILACAPKALAATKKLVARARLQAPRELIDEAAAAFSNAALSEEGTEGTMAFIQKRKARWAP